MTAITDTDVQLYQFNRALEAAEHAINIDAQASTLLGVLVAGLKQRLDQAGLKDDPQRDAVRSLVRLDESAHCLLLAAQADPTVKSRTLDKVKRLRQESAKLLGTVT